MAVWCCTIETVELCSRSRGPCSHGVCRIGGHTLHGRAHQRAHATRGDAAGGHTDGSKSSLSRALPLVEDFYGRVEWIQLLARGTSRHVSWQVVDLAYAPRPLEITNRPEISLGWLVSDVVDIGAGIEVGVADTKTFLGQLLAFYRLAMPPIGGWLWISRGILRKASRLSEPKLSFIFYLSLTT